MRRDCPTCPVYVDSPLAVNASKIFRQHPECYDAKMKELIRTGHPALEFKNLTYINSLEESKALNERTDPMIILSASGMAEAGRIVYHIRWAIENKQNTIMIVSWQAPDTLGRRIADREKHVKIFGETYQGAGGNRHHWRAIGPRRSGPAGGIWLRGEEKRKVRIFGAWGRKGALPLMEKFKENKMRQVHYPSMHYEHRVVV